MVRGSSWDVYFELVKFLKNLTSYRWINMDLKTLKNYKITYPAS